MTAETSTAVLAVTGDESVTVAMLKSHSNIVADDEDANIAQYIAAAREQVEEDSQLKLVRRTMRHRRSAWPVGPIELGAPLISVTSITYIDTDGNSQTWDSGGSWYVDADRRPGVIWKHPSAEWPEVLAGRADAITIEYVEGYAAADVPARATQATLLLAAHYYKHREAAVVGTISGELAIGYERLIDQLNKERYVC